MTGDRDRAVRPGDAGRLESLATYGVLAEGAPTFETEATTAALACGTSSSVVAFLLPDVLKVVSVHGAPAVDIPREVSLSALAAEAGAILVRDSIDVEEQPDHPYAAAGAPVRSLAAVPLIGRDGISIGALGVHDSVPRRFTPAHIEALRTIAAGIMTRLELHRLDLWGGRAGAHGSQFTPGAIRLALEADELAPYFQPIIDLRTSRVEALEALLRWTHPERGVIAPGEFLPLVEASGLMIPVGRLVRRSALDALVSLRAMGPGTAKLQMGVNVSTIELTREGFAAEVLADLTARGLEPESLCLELTETADFVDHAAAASQLTALHDAGVRIALDDYGVGFSSLTRMVDLPLAAVKIDKSLTDHLLDDFRLGTAVAATVWTARTIGLDVIVEGIETAEQATHVTSLGCEFGQGWHFSTAMPLDDVRALLMPQAVGTVAETAGVQLVRTAVTDALEQVDVASLLASWPGAVCLLDTERRVLAWNAEAASLTGYGLADVIGRRCSDVVGRHVDAAGRSLCAVACPVQDAMRHGHSENHELWTRHKDGRLLPVMVSTAPVHGAGGRIVGAIEAFRLDAARAPYLTVTGGAPADAREA